MNIQLQNNAYIPKRGVGGGPVSYLTHGSRALAGRGHAVSILCRRSDVDRLPWATVRQYDYGRIHGRQWLVEPLILARRLRQVVRQHAAGVELALVRNPFFAYAMGTAMPRVPMIYITPGNAAREFAINYLQEPGVKTRAFHLLQRAQYRYIEATALRRSPRVVVFTEIWRRELVDSYGVDAAKISVLPPGVTLESPDIRRDETVYDELEIPREAPIVLCVCRLVRQKNLPFLVRAFAALRHRGAYLVLVGEGPEKASLAHMVAEAGVGSRVRLTGFREDVARFLSVATVFALPSLYESLTFSFLEALGSGVPCIGVRADYPRRVTTADEVIQDGVTGFCIGGASEAELAEALDRILGDPALRRRMGEEARRACWLKYDWGRHVDGLMALAAQMGSGNGSARASGGLR